MLTDKNDKQKYQALLESRAGVPVSVVTKILEAMPPELLEHVIKQRTYCLSRVTQTPQDNKIYFEVTTGGRESRTTTCTTLPAFPFLFELAFNDQSTRFGNYLPSDDAGTMKTLMVMLAWLLMCTGILKLLFSALESHHWRGSNDFNSFGLLLSLGMALSFIVGSPLYILKTRKDHQLARKNLQAYLNDSACDPALTQFLQNFTQSDVLKVLETHWNTSIQNQRGTTSAVTMTLRQYACLCLSSADILEIQSMLNTLSEVAKAISKSTTLERISAYAPADTPLMLLKETQASDLLTPALISYLQGPWGMLSKLPYAHGAFQVHKKNKPCQRIDSSYDSIPVTLFLLNALTATHPPYSFELQTTIKTFNHASRSRLEEYAKIALALAAIAFLVQSVYDISPIVRFAVPTLMVLGGVLPIHLAQRNTSHKKMADLQQALKKIVESKEYDGDLQQVIHTTTHKRCPYDLDSSILTYDNQKITLREFLMLTLLSGSRAGIESACQMAGQAL